MKSTALCFVGEDHCVWKPPGYCFLAVPKKYRRMGRTHSETACRRAENSPLKPFPERFRQPKCGLSARCFSCSGESPVIA